MTVGPLIVAAGTLWLVGVDGSAPYVVEILPGSLLQGLGMAVTITPLTATVLGAAPDALAGIASGVNNAVARAAQLLAVAALPVAVGLSGDDYADPTAFTSGFRLAMLVCAALFAARRRRSRGDHPQRRPGAVACGRPAVWDASLHIVDRSGRHRRRGGDGGAPGGADPRRPAARLRQSLSGLLTSAPDRAPSFLPAVLRHVRAPAGPEIRSPVP